MVGNEREKMSVPRILCFGDSLTWGIIPGTRNRYEVDCRWPMVLREKLAVEVLEAGLNGRTTAYDFPGRPYRNGLETLPMLLEQHAPLSLVVIMLGTNDLFSIPNPTAEHVLFGLQQLTRVIQSPPSEPSMPIPKVMIVTPPLPCVVPDSPYPFAQVTPQIEEQAKRLPNLLQIFADKHGCVYFDASELPTDESDGIHLSRETSQKLGLEIAKSILENSTHTV